MPLYRVHLLNQRTRGGARRLRSELVLLNLDGGAALFEADHFAARDQLQSAFIIELRRPTDRQFQLSPGYQQVIGAEQHPGAGNIDGSAVAPVFGAAFVQHAVADFALDREPVRMAPVGFGRWVWV